MRTPPLDLPDLRELCSWKEIAAYLGVSIKTAQVWERERGLPVRRLPGGRGRVSISVVEIENWKQSSKSAVPTLRWGPRVRSFLAVVLVAATVAVVVAVNRRPGRPGTFVTQRDALIVMDAGGHEVWRHVFPTPMDPGLSARNVWFGDLDADGHTETLFVHYPATHGSEPDVLYCFSDTGRERWHFVPGRRVRTRRETFEPPFGIRQFAVGPLGRLGRPGVVVTGGHFLWWPNQVALLSPDGTLMREYWHSGHLQQIALADVDGDGANEIYLGGVSNAYHRATLVKLDPDSFSGASVEQNQDFQLQGFAPGMERARILFPRTDLNQKFEAYNVVLHLWIHPHTLTVELLEHLTAPTYTVSYELDTGLGVMSFAFSDTLRSIHKELFATGQLDHPLSAQDEARMHDTTFLTKSQ